MKILLLQGNPAADTKFDSYIEDLCSAYKERGFTVELEMLRDMDIRPCTGCFKCWIKTPGKCVIHDDAISIIEKYLSFDQVVLASPLILGYFSALLKNTMDRSIPLMHPHLEEVHGEMHHKKRYEKYPEIGIILQREETTDDEDIEIAHDIFKRMCINMRTDLSFVELTDKKPQEVAHAVDVH